MSKPTPVPFSEPFSHQQLLASGGTAAQLRGWLQRGQVRRLARGVYVDSNVQLPNHPSPPQRRVAVQDGRVPVPAVQAATHHGLWLPPEIPSQLQSADGRRSIPPEYLEQQGQLLIPSLEWTAVQLGRWQPLHGALVAMDCALRLGARRSDLMDVAVTLRRWPGARWLRRAIEAADARSESALESWSRGLMLEAGLPAPELQYEIAVRGFRMRADFAFPPQRVIGEADGHAKYADNPQETIRLEKQRQARLQEAGFVVIRWGWRDVHPQPGPWLHGLMSALQRSPTR